MNTKPDGRGSGENLYSPDSYNTYGQLKLPLLFWLVLLLQARTWVILVMAGASRQQGEALLGLFYPDTQAFYAGLGSGLIALLVFLLSGHRHRFPRLWSVSRLALVLVSLLMFGGQLTGLNASSFEQSPLPLVLLIFDLLSALWLLVNPRLRDGFRPEMAVRD